MYLHYSIYNAHFFFIDHFPSNIKIVQKIIIFSTFVLNYFLVIDEEIGSLVELTRNLCYDIPKIDLEEDVEESIIAAFVEIVGRFLSHSRIKRSQMALQVEKS